MQVAMAEHVSSLQGAVKGWIRVQPTKQAIKRTTPAEDSGRWFETTDLVCSLAIGVLPGDAGDIRAADTDVSEFAIAEPGQFADTSIVPSPGLQKTYGCEKHFYLHFGAKAAILSLSA
jgi:hypothetical protein